jgi:hypothetical protein
MKLVALAFSVAVLGACAAPAAEGPATPAAGENQCHASDYQNLVGRQKSQIPAKPAGATWRVVCSTCAMTMDYNPERLNIVYDETTGVVTKVSCG